MRCIPYAVLLFTFTTCVSVRVNYDYDTETDFSRYTTYHYFPGMASGLSQLDENRLIHALDSVLQAKGYLLAAQPDFFINILSSTHSNASNRAVGIGMGGTGGNVGGGVSVGLPLGHTAPQRKIQFDCIDAQKDVLFWQATAESGYPESASPNVREARLRAVVHKVLSKFPPQKP